MDLAVNNLQRLICHKTQITNQRNHIYFIYMYRHDLVLDNLQWLICHKIQPNHLSSCSHHSSSFFFPFLFSSHVSISFSSFVSFSHFSFLSCLLVLILQRLLNSLSLFSFLVFFFLPFFFLFFFFFFLVTYSLPFFSCPVFDLASWSTSDPLPILWPPWGCLQNNQILSFYYPTWSSFVFA